MLRYEIIFMTLMALAISCVKADRCEDIKDLLTEYFPGIITESQNEYCTAFYSDFQNNREIQWTETKNGFDFGATIFGDKVHDITSEGNTVSVFIDSVLAFAFNPTSTCSELLSKFENLSSDQLVCHNGNLQSVYFNPGESEKITLWNVADGVALYHENFEFHWKNSGKILQLRHDIGDKKELEFSGEYLPHTVAGESMIRYALARHMPKLEEKSEFDELCSEVVLRSQIPPVFQAKKIRGCRFSFMVNEKFAIEVDLFNPWNLLYIHPGKTSDLQTIAIRQDGINILIGCYGDPAFQGVEGYASDQGNSYGRFGMALPFLEKPKDKSRCVKSVNPPIDDQLPKTWPTAHVVTAVNGEVFRIVDNNTEVHYVHKDFHMTIHEDHLSVTRFPQAWTLNSWEKRIVRGELQTIIYAYLKKEVPHGLTPSPPKAPTCPGTCSETGNNEFTSGPEVSVFPPCFRPSTCTKTPSTTPTTCSETTRCSSAPPRPGTPTSTSTTTQSSTPTTCSETTRCSSAPPRTGTPTSTSTTTQSSTPTSDTPIVCTTTMMRTETFTITLEMTESPAPPQLCQGDSTTTEMKYVTNTLIMK